ncbi:hypothetical protein PM082_016765, partial [Marasmius tenuissimus]
MVQPPMSLATTPTSLFRQGLYRAMTLGKRVVDNWSLLARNFSYRSSAFLVSSASVSNDRIEAHFICLLNDLGSIPSCSGVFCEDNAVQVIRVNLSLHCILPHWVVGTIILFIEVHPCVLCHSLQFTKSLGPSSREIKLRVSTLIYQLHVSSDSTVLRRHQSLKLTKFFQPSQHSNGVFDLIILQIISRNSVPHKHRNYRYVKLFEAMCCVLRVTRLESQVSLSSFSLYPRHIDFGAQVACRIYRRTVSKTAFPVAPPRAAQSQLYFLCLHTNPSPGLNSCPRQRHHEQYLSTSMTTNSLHTRLTYSGFSFRASDWLFAVL